MRVVQVCAMDHAVLLRVPLVFAHARNCAGGEPRKRRSHRALQPSLMPDGH